MHGVNIWRQIQSFKRWREKCHSSMSYTDSVSLCLLRCLGRLLAAGMPPGTRQIGPFEKRPTLVTFCNIQSCNSKAWAISAFNNIIKIRKALALPISCNGNDVANKYFCGFYALEVAWQKKGRPNGPKCGVATGIPWQTMPRCLMSSVASVQNEIMLKSSERLC